MRAVVAGEVAFNRCMTDRGSGLERPDPHIRRMLIVSKVQNPMRNVVSVAISCRRCRCRGMYSGPLDVKRTTECAECRHPLVGDHTVTMNGAADPAKQFQAIDNGPATRSSSDR